jgi:hypothetical protein
MEVAAAQKSRRVAHLFHLFSELFCCFGLKKNKNLSNSILFRQILEGMCNDDEVQ